MENPILGGGYTCSECGQYQRTSAVCKHFNLIDTNVKHNPNMKTREEIEKLAFLEYPRLINDPYNPMEDDNTYERKIWIDGYTQCQEDNNGNKYTEEDVINLMFMATKWDTFKEGDIEYKMDMSEFFKYIINSLNKRD
jgi:hypothetical protein